MMVIRSRVLVCLGVLFAVLGGSVGNALAQESSALFLSRANAKVAKAAGLKSKWEGPTEGPKLQKNKKIVYVASDMNDAGVYGVYDGLREATAGTGWEILLIDCRRQCNQASKVIAQALEFKPHGIILSGIDAINQKAGLTLAREAKIPVVGWHASIKPGPMEGLLFTNVTSNAKEAAQIAALYGVVESNSKAGIVVFADSSNPYSTAKSSAIIEVIRQCESCRLLSVEELPVADAHRRMTPVVEGLSKKFGAKWTHVVAVNDAYFDFMERPEIAALLGANKILGLSAGDGSQSAYKRIRTSALQIGTVPEPILLHSWQIVDELNRAFSGVAPSGFVSQVHLVTNQNIAYDGGPKNVFDPSNDFRARYQSFWGK